MWIILNPQKAHRFTTKGINLHKSAPTAFVGPDTGQEVMAIITRAISDGRLIRMSGNESKGMIIPKQAKISGVGTEDTGAVVHTKYVRDEDGKILTSIDQIDNLSIYTTDGVDGFYIDSPQSQSPIRITSDVMKHWGTVLEQRNNFNKLNAKMSDEQADAWFKEQEDLQSTNGTLVNEDPIITPIIITSGDQVTCGNSIIEINLSNNPNSPEI